MKTKRRAKRQSSTPSRLRSSVDKALREHLLELLRGGSAHLGFGQAIEGLPEGLRGTRPEGLPFTAWRLLEHMRIAQRDILEFVGNPKYVQPKWPEGYWPESDGPADATAWDASVKSFRADLRATEQLVLNPSTDLFARIAHGDGQTVLREVLLIADHNAYHLGQIVILRRLLGAWKAD